MKNNNKNLEVTHFGEDYATVNIGGKDFEVSLGVGEALWDLIGQCNHCGAPMYTLVRCHHHTENGKDVTEKINETN